MLTSGSVQGLFSPGRVLRRPDEPGSNQPVHRGGRLSHHGLFELLVEDI